MTQCGFPLPVKEVLGYAYCIAKQKGEGSFAIRQVNQEFSGMD